MTSIKLPGIWIQNIRDHQYVYYRANRRAKPIRIHAPIGSPEFFDAYRALVRNNEIAPGALTPAPRSLSALILSYKQDERWTELAPASRARYTSILMPLDAKYGVCSAVDLDRVGILAIRKHFLGEGDDRTPSNANRVVNILGILCQHATDLGWRKDNPAEGVKNLKGGPGYRMWAPADVQAFLAHPEIGEPLKRAVVVAYYTGLRVSDLVALPRTARAGGVITMKTQKTGAVARVPEHPELTLWLDAAPPSISKALLVREDGTAWPLKVIQNAMTAAAERAGLEGLSFHGLRKGFTGLLATAGATDAEIGALVPHSAAMTAYYRQQADQTTLASAGMAKLSDRRKA